MKSMDKMCLSYVPIDMNGSSLLPLVVAVGAQATDNYDVCLKARKELNYLDGNLTWDKLI